MEGGRRRRRRGGSRAPAAPEAHRPLLRPRRGLSGRKPRRPTCFPRRPLHTLAAQRSADPAHFRRPRLGAAPPRAPPLRRAPGRALPPSLPPSGTTTAPRERAGRVGEKFGALGRTARAGRRKERGLAHDQPLPAFLLLRGAFQALNMSSVKRLVYAIIHFLREQSQMDTFTSDEQESLEVAIQCLETVFKITLEDSHLAVPVCLREMFENSCHKSEVLPLSDSLPEDLEKADQLKDEGNNQMKEENYGAAVDCYSQAIELDPNNAVYYCNRAAAQSKLNNHKEAIMDCERAIAIDPKYSKAYGRMGLALTSMNKYQEAINSYRKALDLDPENDSYKSNLKIAEQKLRDMSSPTGTGISFDMASLINNPAFISMAASLMQNPQVQQLMSGMMTNAIGGPGAGVGGLSDLSSLIHAGQQFAQQIQQQNPELIEQLRNHVRSRSFSGSTEEHS
uniref:Small glutamine-rich tetratricopeptide repeat-containing protein beta isoform X2 n=1 Tax=Pogona vitticeps TaxID=103695 RepID=A0ABM5FTS8_9SAUR